MIFNIGIVIFFVYSLSIQLKSNEIDQAISEISLEQMENILFYQNKNLYSQHNICF